MSVYPSDTATVEVGARRAQQAFLGRLTSRTVHGFVAVLTALPRRLAKVRARHRAYDYLMTLDDRLLADIGLSRQEVRVELANAEAGIGPQPRVAEAPTPSSTVPTAPAAMTGRAAHPTPQPANQDTAPRAA